MSTPPLRDPAVTAWDSYQRMRVRLAAVMSRELARATGLSESDFDVLSALAAAETESVRAIELRCGLEWEKSRLSHQLRRMEQRGLVVRSECLEDSRGSVVSITGAGREIVAEAQRVHDAAVERHVITRLTPEQNRQLGIIAEVILEGLDETGTA